VERAVKPPISEEQRAALAILAGAVDAAAP
jgi:hypothetical protein